MEEDDGWMMRWVGVVLWSRCWLRYGVLANEWASSCAIYYCTSMLVLSTWWWCAAVMV